MTATNVVIATFCFLGCPMQHFSRPPPCVTPHYTVSLDLPIPAQSSTMMHRGYPQAAPAGSNKNDYDTPVHPPSQDKSSKRATCPSRNYNPI